MFNKFFTLTFFLVLIILINPVRGQDNPSNSKDSISITDEYIMSQVQKGKQYILLLLKRGPSTDQNEEAQKIQMAHLHHLFTLKAEGKLVLAGPVTEDTDLRGIGIFNLTDMEQVKKIVEEDPAVKSGRLTYELYPWFGLPGDGLPEK
jgi:uncharacterized protein YciI